MSVAYFIVVDQDDPGFDTFVDGKMLTRHVEAVNAIAAELGLRSFDDYLSQDLSEFGLDGSEAAWFEAAEGIAWVTALKKKIAETPNRMPDGVAVIADLDGYRKVLEAAQERGLKWHLELDV